MGKGRGMLSSCGVCWGSHGTRTRDKNGDGVTSCRTVGLATLAADAAREVIAAGGEVTPGTVGRGGLPAPDVAAIREEVGLEGRMTGLV